MKARHGFVSNSSSSSFIIKTEDLSTLQLMAISNHIEVGKQLGMEWACKEDAWSVNIEPGYIEVSTFMNNFDMHEFLLKIGVKEENIK
jgi:hypothetical protein